jgi:hypothetical protein
VALGHPLDLFPCGFHSKKREIFDDLNLGKFLALWDKLRKFKKKIKI